LGIVELSKTFRFEAAHCLSRVPDTHKCRAMHGHSYHVEVTVRGPLDLEAGWYRDFADISCVVKPLVQQLDHHMLNDIEGLENPTAEMMAVWFWRRLEDDLPGLFEIDVRETESSRCRYRGEDPANWK